MTVAELIEELQALPSTAKVEVLISCNIVDNFIFREDQLASSQRLEWLVEPRTAVVMSAVYDFGRVSLLLDE